MSVEEKLIRLIPQAFASLQEHPTTLIDLIEDLYSADYFDSRIIYKGPVRFDVPVPRMIHIDEFTIWLLTDRYEHTALCDAVVAWRDNQELIGAQHGQGFAYATYQTPEVVSTIARRLQKYPKRELKNVSYHRQSISDRQLRIMLQETRQFLPINEDSLIFSTSFIARHLNKGSLYCI